MDCIFLVVPCKNEERAIPLFRDEVSAVSSSMPTVVFEEIYVDDGSDDDTLRVLQELSRHDECVHYVSLSRNFGKEAALRAGLVEAVKRAGGGARKSGE